MLISQITKKVSKEPGRRARAARAPINPKQPALPPLQVRVQARSRNDASTSSG